MFELRGKYASAKIFTNTADNAAISQITELLNQPIAENQQIRIMPDVHAGAGCTIGTTMTLSDKVIPNLVGVDIGCGMKVCRLAEREIDFAKLDDVIYEQQVHNLVYGMRNELHEYAKNLSRKLDKLHCIKHIDLNRALYSIGTLGGGNHFIEVDKDDNGVLYLVVHSGSRHLGVEIAKYYQEAGYKQLHQKGIEEVQALIPLLKAKGRAHEIQQIIMDRKAELKNSISKELAYVSGELFEEYLDDMKIAQEYALLNRSAIVNSITDAMDLHVIDQFSTIHNYIDVDKKILRKGAVSAETDERLIIPINMRDGSLICVGKGNPDWNYSAPHGAGRLFSRSGAKAQFSIDEYQAQMKGIYTTSVTQATIDECPMAYKPIDEIMENITDTVVIKDIIKPVYNFKNGSER